MIEFTNSNPTVGVPPAILRSARNAVNHARAALRAAEDEVNMFDSATASLKAAEVHLAELLKLPVTAGLVGNFVQNDN